jgi:hypothetical protein
MTYEATAALVLAGVFAFSAAQKANDIRSFQEFVRPLVGHFSEMATRVIIAAEVLLFFSCPWWMKILLGQLVFHQPLF